MTNKQSLKKLSNTLKLSALTLALAIPITSQAEYVSGTIVSDLIHYSIGGGAAVAPPPSRNANHIYSLGIEWQGDFMCGNFDMKTSIRNQLNGITEGFKDLYSDIIESATGAVASLPALIIQRAHPQLYDILTNGLYQGKIDFNAFKTSCEEMGNAMADGIMSTKLGKIAQSTYMQQLSSTNKDAIATKKEVEQNGFKKGIPWIGGIKAGGEGQEPLEPLIDVVKAGFNMSQGLSVTNKNAVPATSCDGSLCTTWQKPEDVATYAQEVLGSSSVTSCTSCGTQTAQPGRGLAPLIEIAANEKATQLEDVLNSSNPTAEQLQALNTSSVSVTRGLVEALKNDPDAPFLGKRLAQELAVSQELEKALMLRRVILTGMKEPNVYNNVEITAQLEKSLKLLDNEIDQVKMELEFQRSLGNNTALNILNAQNRRQAQNISANMPVRADKQYQSLVGLGEDDGTVDSSGSLSQQYIQIPKTTGINNLNGTYSGSSTGSSNGTTSSGNYTVPALSGTATKQSTDLLKQLEGYSSTAYWDVNAYRTGYGSDTYTTADGVVHKVTKDSVITREDAERDLARRTSIFANSARNSVGASTWDSLPTSAQAALTSIAYNYGSLSKLPSVREAAKQSASTGDMTALANAVRARSGDNNSVNAKRRNIEADLILNSK